MTRTLRYSVRLRSAAAALLAGLVLSACQTTAIERPVVAEQQNRCEADYERYADALAYRRWVQKTTGAAGVGLSVAASGSVAVTEVVLIPTLAVAGGAALCGSLLAIEAAARGNGDATGHCVASAIELGANVISESGELDVTRATWQATADWRRQSYDDLALPLLDSIECSLDKASEYDLDQARSRLHDLRADSGIWPHLAADTRIRALRLLQQVEARGRA